MARQPERYRQSALVIALRFQHALICQLKTCNGKPSLHLSRFHTKATIGMFIAKDVPAEQVRFDTRETVTAGPMFGRKTYPTEGPAAEREAAVLRDHKMSPASFAGFGKLVLGTRRHNLIYIDDLTANWEWSLTDCVSFLVMRDRGLTEALTADRRFEKAGFVALLK